MKELIGRLFSVVIYTAALIVVYRTNSFEIAVLTGVALLASQEIKLKQ